MAMRYMCSPRLWGCLARCDAGLSKFLQGYCY